MAGVEDAAATGVEVDSSPGVVVASSSSSELMATTRMMDSENSERDEATAAAPTATTTTTTTAISAAHNNPGPTTSTTSSFTTATTDISSAARPPPPPPRRSGRQRRPRGSIVAASSSGAAAAIPSIPGLPITAFRRPWTQHYIDIGHCRLKKCIQRIQKATQVEIQNLSVSFLALAIKASTAYSPKWKQERALIDYTNAVMDRINGDDDKLFVNDHDLTTGTSAISLAAYFGYSKLLQVLLDVGCPVTNDGTPHTLQAAVKNAQHDCIRLLLQKRPTQIQHQLHQESLATWNVNIPTTLRIAMYPAGDIESVRLLRQPPFHAKVLILSKNSSKKTWIKLLEELCDNQNDTNNNNNSSNRIASTPKIMNVHHWSKELHWSFPGPDRRMLNWLWCSLIKQEEQQQQQQQINNVDVGSSNNSSAVVSETLLQPLLPAEIWLRVFGYVGRGWWSFSMLGDQNGLQDLSPSMRD